MAIVGRVVSTVHVYEAGVGSVLLEASVARTWNVCEPSARLVRCLGDEQLAKEPASSLHSKVLPPSVELKLKSAVEVLLFAGGLELIVVSGATVSTVHVYEAGVASVLPA